MRLLGTLVAALMLILSPRLWATSVEIAGAPASGQTVVSALTVGEPELTDGAYYNPTGIVVGDEFFLYIQGGNTNGGPVAPGEADCPGDKILLFKAPFTTAGMVGSFQFVRRVSPCPNPLNIEHFGPGQVFKGASFHIIADYTVDSHAVDFEELVLGRSSDGVNWTWGDFLTSDSDVLELYSPVMVADPLRKIICNGECHGHETWWGFFPFNTPTTNGTGRMTVDYSSAYPRGFRVHILSGGTWRQVDDSTGVVNFIPDNVWPGVAPRSLTWNVDHWELWGHKNVLPNGCAPCSGGSYDNQGAGSTFTYRWVNGDNGSLGTPQPVYSNIRCMPSDHPMGRLHPFRVNGPSGNRFVYSATNDANACKSLFSPFEGAYVVVTEVSN